MAFQLEKAKATLETILAGRKSYAKILTRHVTTTQPRRDSREETAQPQKEALNHQHKAREQPPIYQHKAQEQGLKASSEKFKATGQVNEEGWILVKRKHKVPRTNKEKPALSPHQLRLKEENRCFNCFAKGHKKSLCWVKVRCIKCFKQGHFSRQCQPSNSKDAVNREVNANATTKNQAIIKVNKETLAQINPNPQTVENIHKPTHHIPAKMDFSDWENIPLEDPDHVEPNRAEDIHVFLEEREHFLPNNQFLDRTAIVMTGPNENTPFLAHRLATRLAMYFRRQPRDFKVRKVHQSVGDLITIFPNKDMLREACAVCAFTLGPGVDVQLAPWTSEAGTMYDPTSNLARLKIYGLPLNRWNRRDVATLISGFGQLVRVAPFFHHENYEYITVLVDVRHPNQIPRYATAGTRSRPGIVQFELDGWLHTSDFPSPVQHRNNRDDRGQASRGGSNRLEYHAAPARHSTTAIPRARITDGRDRQTPGRYRNREREANHIANTIDPRIEQIFSIGEGKLGEARNQGQRENKEKQVETTMEANHAQQKEKTPLELEMEAAEGVVREKPTEKATREIGNEDEETKEEDSKATAGATDEHQKEPNSDQLEISEGKKTGEVTPPQKENGQERLLTQMEKGDENGGDGYTLSQADKRQDVIIVSAEQATHALPNGYEEITATSTKGEQYRVLLNTQESPKAKEQRIETFKRFQKEILNKGAFDILFRGFTFTFSGEQASNRSYTKKDKEYTGLKQGPEISFIEMDQEIQAIAESCDGLQSNSMEKRLIEEEPNPVLPTTENEAEQNLTTPKLPGPHQLPIEEGPPGFPGPPKYAKLPPRRSPRLSSKAKGVYIRPEERARRTTRPWSVSCFRKSHKKRAKIMPVQLDYLKSFNPLSDEQAEAVINQAGIEMKGAVEAAAKEVIRGE